MADLKAICYERNFLKEVVARIDLAAPVEGLEATLPDKLNDVALANFPLREPRHAVARELQISAKAVEEKRSEFTEWVFHGRLREKTLSIAPEWVYVSHKQYDRYEQFRDEFLDVASAFVVEFPAAGYNRLGLRYINQFELPDGDPTDWSGYLNDSMLPLFGLAGRPAQLTRAMHYTEFAEGDHQVRLQYGMHNPDFPAPVRRKLFVVDIDAFRSGLFQHGELATLLNTFHQTAQEVFEDAITAKMREVLGAKV